MTSMSELGIALCAVTYGEGLSFAGAPLKVTMSTVAVDGAGNLLRLVWDATGTVFSSFEERNEPVTGAAARQVLPQSQTGFVAYSEVAGAVVESAVAAWTYVTTVTEQRGTETPRQAVYRYQIPTGTTALELERLPSDQPAPAVPGPVVSPAVTSVNGLTGAVVIPVSASPADATTTTKGVVEMATSAEAVTGTDTSRATTPAGVAAALAAQASLSRVATLAPFLHGKVRGGNLAPKPGGFGWRGLFTEWDWANWIRPQVDRAKLLGLNAVRLIGAPESAFASVLGGAPAAITQATYVARWTQLAKYCQDEGLALYPCLVTASDFDSVGVTYQHAGITGVVKATAAALADFPNVFAFDVFQEGGTGTVLADVLAMMAAVRTVAPNVPLTCSRGSGQWYDGIPGNPKTVPLQTWLADDGADFIDVHTYDDDTTPRDMDFLLSLTDKPVLIGEYGVNQAQSTAEQTSRFQAYADMHNRAGVVGSFLWALADQSGATSDQWGVWDNTGFGPAWPAVSSSPLSLTTGKRTAMTGVLPRFRVQDAPAEVYEFPELLSGLMKHPSTQPWGWLPGNASAASNPRGLALTASTAADMSAETAPASATPVVAGAVYEASVDVLAATTARTVKIEFGWYSDATTYQSGFLDQVTVVDSTIEPKRLRIVAAAPTGAVFAKVIVRVASPAAGEVHYLNNASMRRY